MPGSWTILECRRPSRVGVAAALIIGNVMFRVNRRLSGSYSSFSDYYPPFRKIVFWGRSCGSKAGRRNGWPSEHSQAGKSARTPSLSGSCLPDGIGCREPIPAAFFPVRMGELKSQPARLTSHPPRRTLSGR